VQQSIRKTAITGLTDDPSQPQPAGNHHCQSHPHNHSSRLYPNFVGLDIDHIELPWFNERMMDALTLLTCTISPQGYRTFIQAIGLHNGLDGTPKG
jgi:hypothetical protein